MSDQQPPAADNAIPWDNQEVIARFGVDEIIATGVLFYPGREKPTLYPFKEDRSYGIVIDIQMSSELTETQSSIQIDMNAGITFRVLRYFAFGASSVHYNLVVAVSEKFKYYLNVGVATIGQMDDFWLNIQYNVVRRPLP